MPFLKSRTNLKKRRISKRNQHGGALSKLWCVYMKADGHYFPVFLTNNKDRKDHYLYELYKNYIDEDVPISQYTEYVYKGVRVAELSQDLSVDQIDSKKNLVFSDIVRMNILDYDEDTDVPEQEDIYYFAMQDFDGLIYKVINLTQKDNESHFKDGELNKFYWSQWQWKVDNLVKDEKYKIEYEIKNYLETQESR